MVPIAWVAAVFPLLWPLDYGKVGGAGEMWGDRPRTPGGEKEKEHLYLIASKFERIGWVGELLK